jgi:hypothetical protein
VSGGGRAPEVKSRERGFKAICETSFSTSESAILWVGALAVATKRIDTGVQAERLGAVHPSEEACGDYPMHRLSRRYWVMSLYSAM